MMQRAMVQGHCRPQSRRVPVLRRFKSSFTEEPHYHPKVRALPFALSPQEAAAKIAPPPSLAPFIKLDNLTRNLRDRRLDWNSPLQFVPQNVIAIYLPSWFVDVYMDSSNVGSLNAGHRAIKPSFGMTTSQAFFPGHTMDPLCRMSMRSVGESGLISHAIPFSKDMRRQKGVDVVCMPYAMTPLSINLAATEFMADKFQIKEYMAAAYPILIPVYLAIYSFELLSGTVETYAVAEAASQEGGAVYVKNIADQINAVYEATEWSFARDFAASLPEFEVEPPNAANFLEVLSGPLRMDPANDISQEINSLLYKPTNYLRRYAQYEKSRRSGAELNFDDLRIREWTEGETKRTQEHMTARMLLRSLSKMDIIMSKSGGVDAGDMEQARTAVEDTKPAWLREWEQQQSVLGQSDTQTNK
ncbi:hypothetical protein BDY19DRAFT_955180 [Irpex rosettiformis]|uniref:Uncharacterized protein n=1 Tax=Irpex rosettiformis TaxID=378272 RepID=A0ACB8TZ19_9APHY|nr:hypothetical protein BDY19DRAFT_955180 [Irpex rosettiformis]